MKWIECGSCEEEFRVISDTGPAIAYCPFCGAEIDEEEDEIVDFFSDDEADD